MEGDALSCALMHPSQRRIVSQNIKRLKDIQCYRGKRHIMVSSGVEG
jgi:ribosomal protein S13